MRERPPTREEDREAVARFLAARAEEAFLALYRAHAGYLYALALRLAGGSADEATELAQEAWVRAVERLAAFEGRSALRTWLAGILIRCAHERRRAARREAATDPQDLEERVGEGSPAAPPAASRLELERALAALAPELREVIVLHDLYGFTHAEIGEQLGVAAGTSKSRLFFARRALAARLGAPSPGPHALPAEGDSR
jgi:RNA polymerase sigma-70 factor (ECF subfamily)